MPQKQLTELADEVFELTTVIAALRSRGRKGKPEELSETEFLVLNLLARRGDKEAALRLYRQALQLDPRLSPARYNLGLLLLRSGQAEAAARQLRRAARLRPGHLPSWLGLARAELARGDIAGARGALAQAERLAPSEPATAAVKKEVEAALKKALEKGPAAAPRALRGMDDK